jgi:hypothetical protein
MKHYDPSKPLVSLHVPKCGGQSVRVILEDWFGDNFYTHYYQKKKSLPAKCQLRPGICIHGHFNHLKHFGVMDYYPEVDQYITFLRDPLKVAVSNYFFWKLKARNRQIKLGIIEEGGEHDYRNIDDFFAKRPRSHIINFLPSNFTKDNFKEEMEKRFVYIGVVEDMKTSMDKLSEKMGFKQKQEQWLNKSEYNEKLSPDIEKKFVKENRFAYRIYNHALKLYKV